MKLRDFWRLVVANLQARKVDRAQQRAEQQGAEMKLNERFIRLWSLAGPKGYRR